MSNVQDTIKDLAYSLYIADFIDKKTLNDLTDDELPALHEYTREEIQQLRKNINLANHLNV